MNELTYVRIFDAPRDLVFRCMIEPQHLTHFWGPIGTSAPLAGITVDPRPGGVFETVMVSDTGNDRYTLRAIFVEVTAPERLIWTDTDTGVITTSTFAELGGGRTEVTIHQSGVPEAYRSPQAQAGFRTSLDRFAGHLATLIERA